MSPQTSFLGVEPEQTSFLPPASAPSTRQRIEALARLKDAKRNHALPVDDAPLFDPQVDIEEAIAKAKNLAQRRDVELWSGSRLVKSRPAKAVTHEIHEGCMVPKSAK